MRSPRRQPPMLKPATRLLPQHHRPIHPLRRPITHQPLNNQTIRLPPRPLRGNQHLTPRRPHRLGITNRLHLTEMVLPPAHRRTQTPRPGVIPHKPPTLPVVILPLKPLTTRPASSNPLISSTPILTRIPIRKRTLRIRRLPRPQHLRPITSHRNRRRQHHSTPPNPRRPHQSRQRRHATRLAQHRNQSPTRHTTPKSPPETEATPPQKSATPTTTPPQTTTETTHQESTAASPTTHASQSQTPTNTAETPHQAHSSPQNPPPTSQQPTSPQAPAHTPHNPTRTPTAPPPPTDPPNATPHTTT